MYLSSSVTLHLFPTFVLYIQYGITKQPSDCQSPEITNTQA